ncbi:MULTISPECIES: N-acetyl sugar amidotransferase [Thalassospira]|uniref:N-acetyl sugar amidotransferase n=1 Tax=Thalassospira TaxID=168934 RepID=UPI0009FF9918|nr:MULTISPECIES: N-acetyl sugar amidotransferase [Thalassospira]MBR9899363.1 N-acetyl sugar amidotransferase [Rhodospirillales bacterium]
MKQCRRCLYTEVHPLNIVIDDEGICSGCRVHEEKDLIDWHARFDELKALTSSYKSKSGRSYDCIVPVDGGRDAYFMVHVVKNVLGLKPLLAFYNGHYNTETGIRNLAYLRQAFDCDMMGMNVSSKTVQALTRQSIKQLGSIYWHVLAGQTVWPVRLAIQFKIPLIVWGAHQGVDQVGMFSHLQKVEMTRKYRKEHDLMGMEIEDLIKGAPSFEAYNTGIFRYPEDEELEAVGVRGIYLNNYLRWDSRRQNELMIDLYQYETVRQDRTFDTYSDPNSVHYSGLHDLIKFRKWGYGKVTDHACREIRLHRLTREQGEAFVDRHQNVITSAIDKEISTFTEWVGMTERELWTNVDRFRDPRVWQKDTEGKWMLKRRRDTGLHIDRLETDQPWADYRITKPKKPDSGRCNYVLIGKGFVDGKGPSRPVASTQMPDSSFGQHEPVDLTLTGTK